jgi:periplasmic divalent cation tolerance protein
MIPGDPFAIVLVTAPDLDVARTLAKAILEDRLAACVNLVPAIESHYWWEGKIETGAEVLMVIKTARERLTALEQLVLSKHPYQTAEFLVLPIETGSRRYLEWISASVTKSPLA